MKRLFLLLIITCAALQSKSQDFNDFFCDSTLRIDYIFAGTSVEQHIFLDELSKSARWYGKRQRLAEVPLAGNGTITMTDDATGKAIYRNSFSTLFQEWLYTAEAKTTSKAFENVFLTPMPRRSATISIELRDFHNRTIASLQHKVNPDDILIRQLRQKNPYVTLQQASDTTRCIHIAFVAEGYTSSQFDDYLADCNTAMDALFAHEPFKSLRDRFNIIALLNASHDSDVSQPGRGIWLDTSLGSHFDTFYTTRYLTTLRLSQLHDRLAATPYEHIIILANTEHYGGGGIFNSYNLSYTRGSNFKPVVVHEFGHSFGGLGDEYPYGDEDPMYFADTEPWEPNLTTRNTAPAKWQKLIDQGKAGLVEGGGYLSKGVWRPQHDCRMRTNKFPEFCNVCQDALSSLINFYTK